MMQRLSRLWILATAIIAAVLFAELAIRVYSPEFDPRLQFHMIPGIGSAPTLAPPQSTLRQRSVWGDYDLAVRIDAYGLREPKPFAAADAASIFVVGDQFPFGVGVEEDRRFSDLLERRLGVPVYNISMRGNLPWGHFKLVDYAEHVVGYMHGNEFHVGRLVLVLPLEYEIKRYQDLAAGTLQDTAASDKSALRNWLETHSALYLAVQRFVHESDSLRAVGIKLGLMSPDTHRPLPLAVDDDVAINQTVVQLGKIAALRETVFVIVPSPGQFLHGSADAYARIHDAFIAEMTRSNLTFVDLLPAFEKAGGGEALLFPHELAWNAVAHAAAADALAPVLAAHWKLNKR